MFRKVLIANRGEIALRVIRACRELGIQTVAVYSEADRESLHVRFADDDVCIGPAPSRLSYLRIPALIAAAEITGADAIHPGYGFLAENAEFAETCAASNITFIGPSGDQIRQMGDKATARRLAKDAGVPTVPGTPGTIDDAEEALAAANGIGFPVIIKATAGGGGKGMRIAWDADQFVQLFSLAQNEALAAFGNGSVYVEKYLEHPRHVEIQVMGDRHGKVTHLGERDCSVQRRHQKLVEESPSPAVDDATRARLVESARLVAVTVDFHNAATVEFLLDAQGNHYFLEMNTRLQVEHGVTELVTGLDLVAWQIRVAAGERLPVDILNAPHRGHAIEVRLYAEDPYDGFRPTAGRIGAWVMPDGPGVRVDAGVEADVDLRPEYDPLLVKLMVHAADRPAALARLRRALDETLIGGLQTDAGFLRWLVDDAAFVSGEYDTGLIADRWGDGPPPSDEDLALAALAARSMRASGAGAGTRPARPADTSSAWGRLARREGLRR